MIHDLRLNCSPHNESKPILCRRRFLHTVTTSTRSANGQSRSSNPSTPSHSLPVAPPKPPHQPQTQSPITHTHLHSLFRLHLLLGRCNGLYLVSSRYVPGISPGCLVHTGEKTVFSFWEGTEARHAWMLKQHLVRAHPPARSMRSDALLLFFSKNGGNPSFLQIHNFLLSQ